MAAGNGYAISSAVDVLKMAKGEKESDQLRFAVLTGLVKVGQVTNKDVLNTVLHLLVDGEFDMDHNFVIKDPKNVRHMMELLRDCEDPRLQAEIWSMFIPLLRKSLRNLQACTEIGLIEHVLRMLPSASEMVADLLVDLLGILASYSITVKELKMLFGSLQGNREDNRWPVHAHKLLTILRKLPKRQGPEEFFSFPGKKGDQSDKYNQAISLPPLKSWPYQSGWTFSTWLRLDPATSINVEREKPYLYSFRTSKGIGYSAHFVGNCLVITSMKVKGKGFQHCVKFEFKPRRWFMVTFVHVYNRWSKSELKCYVNGQMVSSTEMSWLVTPGVGEVFDRCFLGAAPEINPDNMFCGQMATVYLFSEALSAQQICAMHKLGSGYKGQYKFENESCLMLSETHRKVLYDGKLSSAIAFMYSPVSCDSQLCLESSPKSNPSYFLHSPHALMSGEVCAILTQSIHSTLHSIGGVQVLFPLFTQLDFAQSQAIPESPVNGSDGTSPLPTVPPPSVTPSPTSSPSISPAEAGICASLLSFLCDLLETSVTVQQQMLHAKGFLVIAHLLEKSPASQAHVNGPVLEAFLKLTKYLVAQPTGRKLLKHLFDYVLFNPELWIYTSVEVQTRLYTYLATEFVSDAQIYTNIRRVSSVLQTMHSLKYYYWVINPEPRSGITPKGIDGPRPSPDEIVTLRAFILLYVKQLILKGDGVLDDELQSMLNYLHTMHEDENVQDVLQLLVALMSEHPKSMVPAFDRKSGVKTVFKLLASRNQAIRLQALKLLGFYLMRSTHKRKTESMNPSNLFSLLGERLLLHEDQILLPTYNVLFEILTERMTWQILFQNHHEPESWFRIENSAVLKVIATLIRNSIQTEEVLQIKRMFLSDLTVMLTKSKENRRTVLQMSIWQEWLMSLAYVHPQNADEQKMTEMVFSIFRILLHHGIKYEYGGWRVWIDTLAILHSKVAYEDFKIQCSQLYDQFERRRVENFSDSSKAPLSTIYGLGEATASSAVKRSPGVKITELKEEKIEKGAVVATQPDSASTAGDDSIDEPMTTLEKARFYERLGFDPNLVAFLTDIVEDAAKVVESRVGPVVNGVRGIESPEIASPTPEGAEGGAHDVEEVREDRRRSEAGTSVGSVESAGTETSKTSKNKKLFTAAPSVPPFRIPDFKWSKLLQKLLSDVLFAVETDIQVWKSHNTKTVIDFVNSSTSNIFVINTVHMISQLADNLINACGGLLPLLASATSANGEIDVIQSGEGLPIDMAVAFLQRLMNLTDILVFASSMGFAELEHEKSMASGGILRQCLRLVATSAVRNCLECRNQQMGTPLPLNGVKDPESVEKGSNAAKSDVDSEDDILKTNLAANASASPIKDLDHLLQEMDINRLRAVVYRDVDDSKQAQFLALSIVYFISVLMVSKYRDVLEPPTGALNGPSSKESKILSQSDLKKTVPDNKTDSRSSSEAPGKSPSKSHTPSPSVAASTAESAAASAAASETASTNDLIDDLKSIRQLVAAEGFADSDPSSPTVAQLPVSETLHIGKNGGVAAVADEMGAKSMMDDVDPGDTMTKMLREDGDGPTKVSDSAESSPSKKMIPPPDMFQDEAGNAPVQDPGVNGESSSESANPQQMISSISTLTSYPGYNPESGATEASLTTASKPEDLDNFSSGFSALPLPNGAPEGTSPASLTHRLENALGSTAPLLKEIMIDFAPFLSKTLIGSHGQELVVGGLTTLKGSSVVELVMLLCSQEWQNSLQKHAGLAFIELVNEGRLLSHATKDHIVRVANEAEFILNRMRAEDVLKHAEFESACAQNAADRKEEEKLCDHLITAARRRDHVRADKALDKVVNLVTSQHGAWGAGAPLPDGGRRPSTSSSLEFWRLDVWEDDCRRRRRLVKNPFGTRHADATLRQPKAVEGDKDPNAMDLDDDASLHAKMAQSTAGGESSHVAYEDEDSMQQTDIDRDFDTESVASGKPVALSTECHIIAPGLVVRGTLSITSNEIYFEVDEEDPGFRQMEQRVLNHSLDILHCKFTFQEIRAIFARRYLLQNTALEIFLASRTAVMFNFADAATVKKVVGFLPRVGVGVKYGLSQQRRVSLAPPKQLYKMSNMTQRWQRREISNFEYLMFLNTVAGRSYNDLNQYPVCPWVLINYESSELDLNLPSNYRDLSKPIGALNPSRRAFFNERFSSWESDTIPPFHFGTHYSTAAFALNWLVRVEPFASMFISLQGGKFDHPNRLFHSVAQAWRNCQRDTSDVKELIPEFFYLPEMFSNKNEFDLGRIDDGVPVGDVELPKWAKSPEEFVRLNRMALESEFVSCQLHHWIDLIFGYKQKGPEAVRATNVFYYLTYEGSVNLAEISDPITREAIENQIANFGQTPAQLLSEPHPPRSSAMHMTPMMFTSMAADDVCMIMKFLSNSPVTHVSGNTHPSTQNPAVITIAVNKNFAVNKWNNNAAPLAQLSGATSSSSSGGGASQSEKDGQPSTANPTAHLPLAMDPILSAPGAQHRRHLGEHYDENIPARHSSFVVTADNRFIVASGFWDNSFRIFSADTGKIVQVIFGHFDVVTVVARSECNIAQDCFLATGSLDATVMLWHWNNNLQQVVGDQNVQGEAPSPRVTLTGHETDIVALVVSAELGLVVSASYQGPVLIHTTTGDLLRSLESPDYCTSPENVTMSREGNVFVNYDLGNICLYTLNGKLLRHRRHEDNIMSMTTSRDGQYLVTGGDGGVVAVWRTHDLNLLYTYPTCDGSIRSVALSHCHQYVITGLSTGSVVVFNIDFNKWHPEFQEKYH